MQLKQLVENVYYQAEWRGANTYFVTTTEGIILIDVPPVIENAKEWAAEIKKRGKIRFVIDTEAHHDHWITNSIFCDQIITHEKTLELMRIMDHNFIRGRINLLYTKSFDFPDRFELRLPNITFSKNMTLHLGQYTFQLIHTPGHTEGQMAVYIPEEKILFTADTVVKGIRTPYHDAITDDRWIKSLETLEGLDIRYIATGHGEILKGKDYLQTTKSIVKGFLQAVKDGKTQGVKLSPELNRTFDPYYDSRPRGLKPGGKILVSSKESKITGEHGR